MKVPTWAWNYLPGHGTTYLGMKLPTWYETTCLGMKLPAWVQTWFEKPNSAVTQNGRVPLCSRLRQQEMKLIQLPEMLETIFLFVLPLSCFDLMYADGDDYIQRLPTYQGDQIGRIFAQWVIVYFWINFEN
jgi:hypothetical protein